MFHQIYLYSICLGPNLAYLACPAPPPPPPPGLFFMGAKFFIWRLSNTLILQNRKMGCHENHEISYILNGFILGQYLFALKRLANMKKCPRGARYV